MELWASDFSVDSTGKIGKGRVGRLGLASSVSKWHRCLPQFSGETVLSIGAYA